MCCIFTKHLLLNKKLSPVIWTSTLHLETVGSQIILLKSKASITLRSEVMAFIRVFRHHRTRSGKRSGSMPPPLIFQQWIHPNLNHVSLSFLSFPLFCLAGQAIGQMLSNTPPFLLRTMSLLQLHPYWKLGRCLAVKKAPSWCSVYSKSKTTTLFSSSAHADDVLHNL